MALSGFKKVAQNLSSFSVPSRYIASNKLIITVALTGNVPTKQTNSNVPMTPKEIATDIKLLSSMGASLFHVHARDADQKPTHDTNTFRQIVKLTLNNTFNNSPLDPIIQLSTGGRAGTEENSRLNVVRLCPEMASFCTGSNNLAQIVYTNTPAFINRLAKTFLATGSKPEIECFDVGHINNAIHLIKKGLLKTPVHFNFVMGTAGGMPADLYTLTHCVKALPPNSTWTCAGIGKMNIKLAAATIIMGGHVRIGLEDMIYDDNGKITTNAAILDAVLNLAKMLNRDIANPAEAREILGLKPTDKDKILPYLDEKSSLFNV